jgi:serine/threonine protein phosphatase PrpC
MIEILRKHSCSKKGEVENEDHYRAQSNLLVVADGAGGAGIYSGEWSEYLVNIIPDQPVINPAELEDLLDSKWEDFFNNCREKSADQDVRAKFLNEGSYSTLSAVWLSDLDEHGAKLDYLAIGDSPILVINPGDGIFRTSIHNISDFSNPPKLINWKQSPLPEYVSSNSFSINKGDYVVLCSDALGQYLLLTDALFKEAKEEQKCLGEIRAMPYRLANLLERLEGEPFLRQNWFEEIFEVILTNSGSQDEFQNYVYGLCDKGLVESDDYTLLVAKVL